MKSTLVLLCIIGLSHGMFPMAPTLRQASPAITMHRHPLRNRSVECYLHPPDIVTLCATAETTIWTTISNLALASTAVSAGIFVMIPFWYVGIQAAEYACKSFDKFIAEKKKKK